MPSRREDEILLADTLALLPADYRDVIVLRHIEGLPFEEVATADGSIGRCRADVVATSAQTNARHPEQRNSVNDPLQNLDATCSMGDSPRRELAEVLERYLADLECGVAPDQQALLAAHPDLADELLPYLESLRLLDGATRDLRGMKALRGDLANAESAAARSISANTESCARSVAAAWGSFTKRIKNRSTGKWR